MKSLFRKLQTPVIYFLFSLAAYGMLDWSVDLPPYDLEFQSEIVRASRRENLFQIHGSYVFFPGHARCSLYQLDFPIVPDGQEYRLASISLESSGTSLPFSSTPNGVTCLLAVTPLTRQTVEVTYSLAVTEKQATYVTLTANDWSKPVRQAQFLLDQGMTSNYHAPGERDRTFFDFRPTENWVVSWR